MVLLFLRSLLYAASLLLLSNGVDAQSWSGIIAPDRAIDWSRAGAGSIPDRTEICATLSPGATASQINSAIANCPAGKAVYLNTGTYNIGSPGIIFSNKSGVTLRGSGANSTLLVFTSNNGCGGLGASICVINGAVNYWGSPGGTANWTGGLTKGSKTITLSSTSGIQVGTPLILDQNNDPNSDTGEVWICGSGGVNVCCVTCASGAGRRGPPPREQTQVVKVTAVSGNQVTIEDPIFMPNFRADRNPGAWWSMGPSVTGVGIENLSMNHQGSGGTSGVAFYNATGSWLKGVRSLYGNRNHVWLHQSAHITIRDSYFYGTQNSTSQSYGVEHFTASANLIENNIFQRVAAPLLTNNGNGSVFGYNYIVDDHYTPAPEAAMAGAWHHGAGTSYHLYEGNDWSIGLRADYFHGLSFFGTAFRNRFQGYEPGKTQLTIPIFLQMGHRYFNIVGNVLGTSGVHKAYQVAAGGSPNNCNTSIFALGWGGYCVAGTSLPDDPLVAGTMLRWGNYDTVNNAVRNQISEVPSGISKYANPVPTAPLPASFYLPGRPAWWSAAAWPAIGPDVSGGNGPGGKSYSIPAGLCYAAGAKDPNGILLFDASACYSSGTPPRPEPPTNLMVKQ